MAHANNTTSQQNQTPRPQAQRGGPMGFGGGPMRGAGEKAKNFAGTMKQLASYLRPFWVSIILTLVLAIAGTVLFIVGPKILGNVTSLLVEDIIKVMAYDRVMESIPAGVTLPPGTTGADIINRLPAEMITQIPANQLEAFKEMEFSERPSIRFDEISRTLVTLIILYLISSLFTYIQGWVLTNIAQKISYNFRREISLKINRMPLQYFDSKTHGEVLSRVTNDVDTVSQTLNQSLSQIVTSFVTIIGVLVMMLTISWQMTLVAMLILPVSMILISLIVKQSQGYFKQQQASLGHINGHIEEMYGGHNVMKVFNGEKRSIAKFVEINADLYKSGWKSQFFSGMMMPLMGFIGNLGYVAVCILGGYLAIKGTVRVGDIQAFIQYLRQFTHPVTQMAQVANVLQSTAAAAERVFEFLNEQEEVADVENPVVLEKVNGAVDFENVIFGYDPEKIIIKGFTAHVKPGQRIAIVGPTGAGKTTMVNLLMRFYDVNSGAIKVDGINIRDMRRADLRRMFGMVLQDAWLFNGSIRENLIYSKPDATEEEIQRAAKAAQVDHYVHSLPGGYNMVLNEETSNISQGEKQLLTIARAMLANPPILILDEATSSVDTRTEVLIQKAMANLMKNRTSFVIAHRLSTIREADLILVMNDGNIVEQGTHQNLLAQKGFYAELYNSQFTGQEAAV